MVILTNSIILPTTTTTDNEERQETLTDSTTLVDAPQKITTTVESTGTDNHQTLMRNNSNNQQIDHPKKKQPYGGRPLRFHCPDCDRKFHAPSHLKRHRLCHTSERPFQCHICKKGFLQAWHLGRHMTIHTGNKPFRCSECPKTFGSRFEMKTHCNYIHRGIKEHECEVCKKMFTLRSNLKVHMRKHTGEKPYECEVCFKRFGQRGHLQYHMRKHEDNKKAPTSKKFSVIKTNIDVILMKEENASLSEYGSEFESGSSIDRASPTFPSMISPVPTIFEQSITSHPEHLIKPVPIVKGNSSSFKYSTDDIPLSGRMFDHTNPREIKPFVCVSCNCGFGEINSIRAHARHSHARNGITNELFSCAYCCSTFTTIDTLKYHFDICKQKLQGYSTLEKEEGDLHERPMKRSSSEVYIDVKASKRSFPSPGGLSTTSDTTWDRISSFKKSYYYDECPYDGCNCAKSRDVQRFEDEVIQTRYLEYLELCQKVLESHVQFMEALKVSGKNI